MTRALPPLNALRVFEAAARHLSFTKAAEELDVTPAAVSHHVRMLEQALKFPLFVRETRQVVLTSYGRSLLPVLQQSFTQLSFSIERMRRGSTRPHLTVRLPPYLSAWWLTPRLASFFRRYPEVDLRLEHLTEPVDFSSGHIDLAVHWAVAQAPGIAVEPLIRTRRVPMCSRELLRGGRVQAPADLRGVTLLHEFDYRDWESWFVFNRLDPAEARRGIVIDNYDVLFRAIAEGQGVGLLMMSVGRERIAEADLALPLGTANAVEFVYNLYYPHGALGYPIIREFRQWLLDQAADIDR
ncbi:MAG: LysR substrate-binding domain-containing protein [Dongiaceae bacterium]